MILVADDKKDRLEELTAILKTIYPKETVLHYSDPLLAGKYAFFNPVDILFTGLGMRRMSGIQLKKMVRYANSDAKVFLTGLKEEFDETDLIGESGEICEPGITGVLFYPLEKETVEALAGIKAAPHKMQTDSTAENSKTIEDVYEELVKSDILKHDLAQAALSDCLEEFFGKMGLREDMEEIQRYFQKRIMQKAELDEEQLGEIWGGAYSPTDFRRLILSWIG